MNIVYLSLSYVPSRRASSVHVMRMCAALGRAGHRVELVAKRSHETAASGLDDHAFYGVGETFTLTKLARPRRRGGGVVFAAGIVATLVARRHTDLVYSRDVVGAAVAARLGMPLVFESHGVPGDRRIRALTRWLVRRPSVRGVVAISEALRRDLAAERLLPEHAPTIVAHDAADPVPLVEHVPGSPPRIGYIGNLYPGRGVELVVELAARLPDCTVEIVGGSDADLATWRARPVPANLRFVGFVPPGELAARYRSFDVLLMPYPRRGIGVASGANDTSRWCSPMKMFEYMASGVPMIASDLPVLGEVLIDGVNATIAPAGDAAAWQAALERTLADPATRVRQAVRAQQDLRAEYTWSARAARVMLGLGLERATAPTSAEPRRSAS